MKKKIYSALKKNNFVRRVYSHFVKRLPFLENMLSLYRYSNWLRNYKSTISNQEVFFNVFDELNRETIKSGLGDEEVSKPILIMTTYNDHDIIESIIRENAKLGYEQIIIDNWSSDGTWPLIEKLKLEIDSILDIQQYPFDGPTNDYQWKAMLDLKSKIALNYKGRWILHQDSDEITISPFLNRDIGQVLHAVKKMGYNVVPLRMLDFTPIDNTFTIGNPVSHFEYYRLSQIISYGLQNKVWLQGDSEVDLSGMGGHDVNFLGKKVFPIRLPRFHYSIRSIDHAKSKYSPKRLERSASERETLGWHTHVEVKLTEKIIYEKQELIKYDFNELYSSRFNWFIYND
ncbi:glycosyltransferase family 2 protein [Pantoea allii]|uniref:glycosyltransferase family 2 protein n=1 Tax=Pantoea allii TaxID=574096 RepID=UPI0039778673